MKNFISTKRITELKLFLLPSAIITVVLILTALFLVPKFSETQEILVKTDNDKRQLETLEKKSKKLTELGASSLFSDYERVSFILPSEKNIPAIISALSELEATNNVLIEGIRLTPGFLNSKEDQSSDQAGGVGILDFSISVTGSKNSVLAFIEQIQNSGPFFRINAIGIQDSGGSFVAVLGVSTYYQPLPQSLGKIDSRLTELSASQKITLNEISRFKLLQGLPPITEDISESSTPSAQPTPGENIFKM